MGLLLRHPLPVAICGLAVAIVAGVFVFARPQYRAPHQGTNITIPDKRPAADAAGAAGWVWPDGVPGWQPGETIGGYPVSELQPIEAQPAQLAAAHFGLDAGYVRVLESLHLRPGVGPLALFAAPMLDVSPRTICLGAMLPRGSTVTWRCPGASPVLVAADSWPWAGGSTASVTAETHVGFALVGVARGDVKRIVLRLPGEPQLRDSTLYARGTTWGQFSADVLLRSAATRPELRVYDDHRLLETLVLALRPGEQRIVG